MVRAGRPDCNNYLDNFCVVAGIRQQCAKALRTLVAVLRHLCFYVSFTKVTPPSVTMRFLGIEIESVAMELRLPLYKLEKLKTK
jgi:hypothetical protein